MYFLSVIMEENDLTYLIRGAIFEVYNTLGPGLLESIYVAALVHELSSRELGIETEVPVKVIYKGFDLQLGFRMDILADDDIIIEVKSVETLAAVHHKQLLTYLKICKKHLGLLVNFNVADMSTGIIRKVNGYL